MKRILLASILIGGIFLVGCGQEETPAPGGGDPAAAGGAVTPGKTNNASGAAAPDQAMAAPPGVKTGTP